MERNHTKGKVRRDLQSRPFKCILEAGKKALDGGAMCLAYQHGQRSANVHAQRTGRRLLLSTITDEFDHFPNQM